MSIRKRVGIGLLSVGLLGMSAGIYGSRVYHGKAAAAIPEIERMYEIERELHRIDKTDVLDAGFTTKYKGLLAEYDALMESAAARGRADETRDYTKTAGTYGYVLIGSILAAGTGGRLIFKRKGAKEEEKTSQPS